MIYGYARVSSQEQNLDRQLVELAKYVETDKIIIDKASGKNLERSGYAELKGRLGLRSGDTLYITSLDRLSRNKNDIKAELEWFKKSNVRLYVLNLPTTMIEIATGQEWILEMINNVLIEVLSAMAEQERKLIRERQRAGIEIAKAKGKHLGRPAIVKPPNWEGVMDDWKNEKISTNEALEKLQMSKTSFYRLVTVEKSRKVK